LRLRVVKINEHAVAHVLGNKPVDAPDDVGNGAGARKRGSAKGGDGIEQPAAMSHRADAKLAQIVARQPT
jgi:hypothetical protein